LKDASVADHQLYTKLRDAMIAYFGKRSPMLTQFGIKPRQPRRQLTPEQKVVRAQKARLTRAARHTTGKRQKAAVKFDGTLAVTVNPVEPSGPKAAAPAASPTP
jgi:hypothetical protein